jgi:hypothetical protein
VRIGPAPLAAVVLASASLAACGSPPPPPPLSRGPAEPHWQDVLDTMPELLVIVRPQALRQDRVYGPLLRRAIEAARDQSKVVASIHPLETIERAEEVVIGVHPDTQDQPGEVLMVERGVPAEVDPGKLVDDDGRPLWAPGASGLVRELVRERDSAGHPVDASLFELPGRTWVVVTGGARLRARDAFAHPVRRPALDLDPTALALVRIDGPSLVARVHGLQDLGSLGAVGRRLKSVTFTLPPGADGSVKATLGYADEDAAAFAEVTLRQVVTAVLRSKSQRMAWLGLATVERPDKRVVVTAPLPPTLVSALLGAGSAPIDFDIAPAPGP